MVVWFMELPFWPLLEPPLFLPPLLLVMRFIALSISFSMRSMRSSSSSPMASSSGHCASGDVDPPKRRIMSTVVMFALAGSRTWMPPASPMSPSPNSQRSSSRRAAKNFAQRCSDTKDMASVTTFPRFRRAYPTMSWYVDWYAQFSCAISRFEKNTTVTMMYRTIAVSKACSSPMSSYSVVLYIPKVICIIERAALWMPSKSLCW
mmetsp:Transcript_14603/g.41506  ORF Transcript_14603/g.41506 Transcript_14603/m.41506 type:complete len:205 (+) Transcript_14603:176-790(+)